MGIDEILTGHEIVFNGRIGLNESVREYLKLGNLQQAEKCLTCVRQDLITYKPLIRESLYNRGLEEYKQTLVCYGNYEVLK